MQDVLLFRYSFICQGTSTRRQRSDPLVVVVVLPDPFRGVWAWRNSTETQQSGHAPKSGPEAKHGRNGAEDCAPERPGSGTVKEEVGQILQRGSAGAA